MVHEGQIVYENYPAMHPEDHHLWASVAKTVSGLVIELLVSDGEIDLNKTLGFYVPEFRGSTSENIKVVDAMDMTTGTNAEENDATRADPNSIASRVFLAELNMPYKGKVERLLDVLREAAPERAPGTRFEYGSPTTQTLVILA